MTKLTGAALDRVVAHAMGLKSVNNCEKWGENMKEHFCPAEQSIITYQGECSWCGEKEALAQPEQDEDAIIIQYHEATIKRLEKRIEELLAQTQEPVQARTVHITWNADGIRTVNGVPDYTTPPQRTEQDPRCMKMNGCKTKCEDCPDEPPQHTERPVDCERCNRLEEQAYDLVGKLRVANIKLSMQPQRTWVDLTDEELKSIEENTTFAGNESFLRALTRNIEAKLKELNT